jgi:hypothetical protein
MRNTKPFIDPRQLLLFPNWEETCPLCGMPGDLTMCKRLYELLPACRRCTEGLKRYGWQVG